MQLDRLFEHAMEFPPVLLDPAVDSREQPADVTGLESATGPPSPAAIRALPGGGGVYLLTDADDRLIQLGSAGDLRRSLAHRLWGAPEESATSCVDAPSRPKLRLAQIVRKIRWRSAHSMFETDLVYYQLARRLLPDSYLDQVAFGPSWFVHVDPEAEIPRFRVGKSLRGRPGHDLGPFATQADANRYIQILEDVFDLCRYTHILEQVPNGQPCAYYEMGRCPAPCNGSIPLSAYRNTVRQALAFACGERERIYAGWGRQMQEASAALAFERASLIKQRQERSRGIESSAFRYVRPIEAFNYLIVQRGRGRTRVKPFWVRSGRMLAGQETQLKVVDSEVPLWLDMLQADKTDMCEHPVDLSEQVWLVSHYLFKRDPPGLIFHRSELADAHTLAEQIREKFQVPSRKQADDTSDTAASDPSNSGQ